MTGPVCPDCAAGKHAVCGGEAYDADRDELVLCGCVCPAAS